MSSKQASGLRVSIQRILISYFVFCLLRTTTSRTIEKNDFSRTFHKPVNFTIGGLFPIHVRSCQDKNFRSRLMALSEAMVFAVEEINRSLVLLPHVTLGYDIQDTCLVTRKAMQSALKFVNLNKFAFSNVDGAESCGGVLANGKRISPISAVIGTGNSGSSILVSNLLNVENIPLISYAATSDSLSSSAYPTFLRTVPPDRFQSRVMAEMASYFNWTYVAAVAVDNAYGQSGIEEFSKISADLGICVAYQNYFPPAEEAENNHKIELIISDLKKKPEIQVIILYSTQDEAVAFLTEAVRLNLLGRTWIASEAWGASDKILTDALLPVAKGVLGVVFPDIEVQSFKRHLLSKRSSYRPASWWKYFWESEFNCVFGSAKKPCGDNLAISENLYANKLHDRKSAFVIDAVFAVAHALDAVLRCQERVGNDCPDIDPFINTEDLLAYLKKVNFSQFNQTRLAFDENGDPAASSYSIVNLQPVNGKMEIVKVGTWMQDRSRPLQLNTSLLVWNDGKAEDIPRSVCNEQCPPGYWQTQERACCWECIRCAEDTISKFPGAPNCSKCGGNSISNSERTECVLVPVRRIGYTHPVGVLFLSIAVAGMATSTWFACVFYRYNDTPIVKASNRELSYMLLFCIAMCYATPFLYLAEPSSAICPINQAWFYLFYTACVAILGAKTNRIVSLFETHVPRSALASSGWARKHRHILSVMCVVAVDLLVIVAWVIADPPIPNLDKTIRTEYFHLCKLTSGVAGEVFQYLLMCLLISISIFCCYFAYRARKLPHNFNEAKFIAFSFYVLVLSWATFYPVYLNIQGLYTVAVSCSATVIAATGLLVCIFVPKIYIILHQPEKNTVNYTKAQITGHTFRKSVAGTRDRNSSILQNSAQNSVNDSATPNPNCTTGL